VKESIRTLESIQEKAFALSTATGDLITLINTLPPKDFVLFNQRFNDLTAMPLTGIPTLLQQVESTALNLAQELSSTFRAEPLTHSQVYSSTTSDLIKTVVERTIDALQGFSVDEDLPPSATEEITASLLSKYNKPKTRA
jgi:hypothetical protein